MLNNTLIKKLFEAASIQRWNDHIRPSVGFTELDKQAQKMVIAYILGKLEEKHIKMDWVALIEGGIFELLQRVILTDIKPPIFHQLMRENGEKINSWTLTQIEKNCGIYDKSLIDRAYNYFFNTSKNILEKKILKSAHYLATKWEFTIVRDMNKFLYGIDETSDRINSEIENHYDLTSVKEVVTIREKVRNFIDMVGQLRFQKRWATTPRVPETSVLGHMLVVAIMSYFKILGESPCFKRKYNVFFGGLLHDLPEVLTRDIISPVKHSIEGLDSLIKKIENEQVENRLLPLLPNDWHSEIRYFVYNEFNNKIIKDNKIAYVQREELGTKYNSDEYAGLDGSVIKECDILSAYYEASLSIEFGIRPESLIEAVRRTENEYPDLVKIRGKK
jgi:putative hydrolase of HD superfamily